MGFEVVNGLAGRNDVVDAVMVVAAGPLTYLLFAAGGLAVLVGMHRRDLVTNVWTVGQGAAALLLTFVVSRGVRMLGVLERPFQSREVTQLVDHEPGVSFPSNHATAALTVALVVAVFVSKRWGAVLMVPAVLISVSRVYVGVHWLSDVAGAAALAVVCVALVWWLGHMLRRASNRPQSAWPAAGADDPTAAIPRPRQAPPTGQQTGRESGQFSADQRGERP